MLIDQAKASTLFGQLRTAAAGNPPSAAPSPPTKISVAPAQVRLSVLNGSGRSGLAAQATAGLRQDGFTVVQVGNTVPTDHTVVRYGAGREEAARTVAAAVPGATLVTDASLPDALALVIGSDFTSVQPVVVGGGQVVAPPPAPVAPSRATGMPADQAACAP